MSAAASAQAAEARIAARILMLSAAAFASAAAMRICDAMLPELAQQFGVRVGDAGAVVLWFSVAYGVALFAYGPLGDRFGKLRMMAVGCAVAAVACVACALAPRFDALLAARVLCGAGAAAVIPLAMAWIGDNAPYEIRQKLLARFLLGQILGMVLGQLGGGLAADTFGWRTAFWLLVAGFAAAGVWVWRAAREEAAPAATPLAQTLLATPAVLRRPWARRVLLVVGVEGALIFGPFAFVASYLHLRHGVSLTTAGLLMMFWGAGGALYALSAGRVLGRLGESRLALVGGLMVGAGLLLHAASPLVWTAPLANLLCGAGFYALHNTLQTHATQMAPEMRGTAVALFATSFFIGQSLGVWWAARLMNLDHPVAVFAIGAVGVAAVGAVFAALIKRRALAAAAA